MDTVEIVKWSAGNLVWPLIIGVVSGVVSSHLVSRRFYKKALLDECSRLIRRLCPYRKANVRDGDGLEETGWALRIQSETMHRLFRTAAAEISALSAEIGAVPEIDTSREDERCARDQLKETWKKRVMDLY